MSYQGNYPPSSPLTSSQIADGAVQPADLSAGGPSWNGSGGLIAAAPFFENSQTGATGSTYFKAQCSVEEFDTANCYDTSTYRFTPNVAGYYQVSGAIYAGGSVNTSAALVVIYKNGSIAKYGAFIRAPSPVANLICPVSAIIYMNGSTDYLELYAYADVSGTVTLTGGSALTFFQAALIRGA